MDGIERMDGAVIRFAGVTPPLRLIGCSELEPLIDEVCQGWPHRRAALRFAREQPGRPAIIVWRVDGGYELMAPNMAAPLRQGDPVAAVCDIIVHLVHGWVAAHRRRLCLHAGAVRIGGRLVVFPSAYRSGKSVLVTHLAALGHEVFSDDVLPLEATALGARGMALGIAPRLRLPLPECFDGRARAFLGPRRGAEGARYVYVRTDDGPFAAHGRTARVGALVHLDRQAGAEASLTPMAPGEMLRRVIARNFARARPAPDILARIEALVRRVPCYRLRYDAPGAAAALLGGQFASWRRCRAAGGHARAIALAVRDVAGAPPGSYVAAPGVAARQWGEDVFLVDAKAHSIYHLDPIAAALWRQCAAPMTEQALGAMVAAAFPDTPPATIAADIARLMEGLRARGLVRRVEAAPSVPLRGRSLPIARCG